MIVRIINKTTVKCMKEQLAVRPGLFSHLRNSAEGLRGPLR